MEGKRGEGECEKIKVIHHFLSIEYISGIYTLLAATNWVLMLNIRRVNVEYKTC